MPDYEKEAKLSGKVTGIRYRNDQNGYSIFNVDPDAKCLADFDYTEVTVVGELVELSEGDHIDLVGKWVIHPKFGHQVKMIRQNFDAIFSREGLYRFLSSGLVKGIGDALATALVERFGEELPEIIENDPVLLQEVKGITPTKVTAIVEAWREKAGLRNLMVFLQDAQLTNGIAVKIYKAWEDAAIDKIKTNPYSIMEVSRVGFKIADQFALSMGIESDSEERILAGVEYALEEAAHFGHTFLPMANMLKSLQTLIGVSSGRARSVVYANKGKLLIVRVDDVEEAVFSRNLFNSELNGAKYIIELLKAPRIELPSIGEDDSLTDEQMEGLQNAISDKLSVITGGPGTGKSYCIKALLDHLDKCGKSYSLAAPTGRAAKRMAETTGREGMTLHRMLGLTPMDNGHADEFQQAKSPLDSDFFIIDEYSMVDAWLNYKLFEKLPAKAHVMLVGDVDQLPSVGAGNVLRDIIYSGLVPVTRLTKIFRQEESSEIVINAHKINSGQHFQISNENGMYHFATSESATAAKWIVDEVFPRINKKLYIPYEEIQVLCPMYKGTCGVDALNYSLREKLNPDNGQESVNCLGRIFRIGDRVMQIKNDYGLKVFNGDTGYVVDIQKVSSLSKVTIQYEDAGSLRMVEYDMDQLTNVVLAYAITIHKSQGCEYPGIIVALLPEHYPMLQRNLFYTAVTRSKKACVIVGDEQSMRIAITNDRITRRYTALKWFLYHNDWKELVSTKEPQIAQMQEDGSELDFELKPM